MSLFLNKSFGAYLEAIEQRLKDDLVADGSEDQVILYCNIAAAQYELGLYRNCIKSCQLAKAVRPNHLRGMS